MISYLRNLFKPIPPEFSQYAQNLLELIDDEKIAVNSVCIGNILGKHIWISEQGGSYCTPLPLNNYEYKIIRKAIATRLINDIRGSVK